MDNHEEDDAEEIKHSVSKRQKKGISSTGKAVLSILLISNLYNFYPVIRTLQGETLPFEFFFSYIAFAFITLVVAIYYFKKESPRGMNNNDDVLHQAKPLQSSPPKEKEWSPRWAAFLIVISIPLIIAHVIFLGPLLLGLVLYGLPTRIDLGFIGVFGLLFPFSLIDFIIILLCIITLHPRGIAESISHIALTIVGLILFYSGIMVMSIYF